MSTIDDVDFEDDQTLPPLWGKSYWWSRSGALLGLTSLILGVVMVYLLSLHVGSCGLARQLTTPTLAVEVAGSWQDLLDMVGTCEISDCRQSKDEKACDSEGRCQTICPDKVRALANEQYLDFVFIIVYWLFFLFLGVMNWKVCFWHRNPLLTQALGKICGAVTIVAGSLGAYNDWLENNHILQALNELHFMSGPAPIMRYFAYTKWKLLFLAIGTASPLFIFWPGKSNNGGVRSSAFSHFAAWATAILAISTSWTGVAACIFGDDHRLEVATKRLDLVILATTLTLATAQYWRGGTMAALDRLAKLPVFAFFANLFSSENDSPRTPGIDPNQMP